MKKLVVLLAVMLVLMLCFAMGVSGLGAASSYQQSHALAMQAHAAIAQAEVAQSLASTQRLLVIFVILVFLLLAGGMGVGLWLLLQERKKAAAGQWLPGPNARWGRVGQGAVPAALPDTQTLLTLALLERLFPSGGASATLPAPQSQQTGLALVRQDDSEDDDFWSWWWSQQG